MKEGWRKKYEEALKECDHYRAALTEIMVAAKQNDEDLSHYWVERRARAALLGRELEKGSGE